MEKVDALIEAMEHPFLMTIFGIVLWYVLQWSIDKNKSDSSNGGFDGQKWILRNYDDMLVSLLFGFALVAFDDEILAAYNSGHPDAPQEFHNWYYLLSGAGSKILYTLFTKFVSLWGHKS